MKMFAALLVALAVSAVALAGGGGTGSTYWVNQTYAARFNPNASTSSVLFVEWNQYDLSGNFVAGSIIAQVTDGVSGKVDNYVCYIGPTPVDPTLNPISTGPITPPSDPVITLNPLLYYAYLAALGGPGSGGF
jgi:hypothetical protein